MPNNVWPYFGNTLGFYLSLLKHSLIFHRIDRSFNKKCLCDSNSEMHLYYY